MNAPDSHCRPGNMGCVSSSNAVHPAPPDGSAQPPRTEPAKDGTTPLGSAPTVVEPAHQWSALTPATHRRQRPRLATEAMRCGRRQPSNRGCKAAVRTQPRISRSVYCANLRCRGRTGRGMARRTPVHCGALLTHARLSPPLRGRAPTVDTRSIRANQTTVHMVSPCRRRSQGLWPSPSLSPSSRRRRASASRWPRR
jgi:hypothetical protein